jgi:hypothetical protein
MQNIELEIKICLDVLVVEPNDVMADAASLFRNLITRYHNNVTNLIHFHFHNHFIVS